MPLERPKWEIEDVTCPGCRELASAKSMLPKGEEGIYLTLVPFDPDREVTT